MLSNYLIGPEKVVLFIDNNAYEPFSNDILQSIARSSSTVVYPKAADIPTIESSFKSDIEKQIATLTEKPNVILASVSRLELNNSVRDVIRLVHFLKQNTKIGQIFIWCSRKSIQDDKIIPFLQYLANVEVTLRDVSNLQIFTKRNTGSVTRKDFAYTIGSNFEVTVREKIKTSAEKQSTAPQIDPESLSTFRIAVDENEQESRDALRLPYEKNTSEQQTGYIHYQPDSDDDFDDEDPDEDLDI